MDFQFSEDNLQMQRTMRQFMDRHVLPQNREWQRLVDSGVYPSAVIEPLKALAKEAGLWNLFLPGLREGEPGTRLTNMEYAPLAEIMGRIPWAAEVFNCNAPDTGNMEMLHLFATPEQHERWLQPLLAGEMRSCFSMTEPDVASSDATNIQTTIRREGGEYVINGRKWFSTGALHPLCRFTIVMGVSDESPDASPHSRHSMVIVPLGTPGFTIVRNVAIMHHHTPEGHCEVTFENVRVPVSNLLGQEGAGFALAQARLGPGRVHHCMRSIGQCELAMELMCERALTRKAFGKHLSDFANVQDWIAHSRVEIDQARLLVLRAAWLMDTQGNKAARIDVSAIKLVAALLQTRVLDRAMQVFGAMGITPDTPLSYLWTWGRAMRFFDGPDEVHLRAIARHELGRAREHLGSTAAYYNAP
ncbi:MAG: acyl-CoA dehydrogenase family protein [Hydrogenophaga sp.]|uniref:acyl-CoA dehydrogenase family protein n=1 Tax=Hydrogenophaga sp. TaxID=1904254 RepID=UPI0027216B63|nr:acyl-CoA dehydrogenase family protein [Hydrogenophaga sp.]MDO9568346.1 acyl-CoA dehydrogenase family protein [Hydrogenophaga sp.]MDP2221448.1 acyl-CoA dehydrogenase family protein [Hydrogenophaga sp.]MDP3345305.1 acyl-CoA dehydrogenase family protein [Hydrogenophaga sp.]MDP3806106.1 acyl-CoA dehydrogenase family protein [Hydrogenophaga sp.]MDZ4240397.1 acyl-CoA dehydrogenase family protein [Hydrogenophaga sp.]